MSPQQTPDQVHLVAQMDQPNGLPKVTARGFMKDAQDALFEVEVDANGGIALYPSTVPVRFTLEHVADFVRSLAFIGTVEANLRRLLPVDGHPDVDALLNIAALSAWDHAGGTDGFLNDAGDPVEARYHTTTIYSGDTYQ